MKESRPTKKILLKTRTFAEATDMSASNVYALVEKGIIRAVRIGGAIRIPTSELDRLTGMASEKEGED